MKLQYMDGNDFRKALVAGAQTLGENKELVNSLNVFPVPDGDTGTNMYLTVLSAVKESEKVGESRIGKVAAAASMGSLMGARGNSGVIFSQILRGFSRYVEPYDRVDGAQLAKALERAAQTAYQAVLKPVEGTMLTVARELAKAALDAAKRGDDIVSVLDSAIEHAQEVLDRTPEMLPTLKEAGVVDAGGKGLLLFIIGLRRGLLDEGIYVEAVQPATAAAVGSSIPGIDQSVVGLGLEDEHPETLAELEFGYCTEFILKGQGLSTDQIRKDLQGFGDCLLVVGTDEVVKIHIHTANPGIILDYGVKLGQLSAIDINNMDEQKEEFRRGGHAQDEVVQADAGPTREVGIVAVAVGEGIEEIFKSLNVDEVVRGGQTMNPSAEDLASAVRRTRAAKVLVLPNNGNVVLTARQVQELVDAELEVVPTETIPQGIAALIAYDPDASIEDNAKAMASAAKRVKTGEVTYAVRDSSHNGVEVSERDFIGIAGGELRVAGKQCAEVVRSLVTDMVQPDDELITLFYGEDVSESEASRLAEQIAEDHPTCEVELQYGGQPLYYYIIMIE
ncbi:MAG TPA: DAK2 domain-containing protein [Bacillota bacterium]|nr:DAK2 domain-containing protein [Bacillota bacterium]HQD18630.1 DAK2 domain-containing protein [Bacillota bacterium]